MDDTVTIGTSGLLREPGWCPDSAEPALSAATGHAYDLVQDCPDRATRSEDRALPDRAT